MYLNAVHQPECTTLIVKHGVGSIMLQDAILHSGAKNRPGRDREEKPSICKELALSVHRTYCLSGRDVQLLIIIERKENSYTNRPWSKSVGNEISQ